MLRASRLVISQFTKDGKALPRILIKRRPVTTGLSVQSRATAIDILAQTLWGEARGEPRLGKEAVTAVVLNRLRRNTPRRFGATVEEVCRKPQQFSCWNPKYAKKVAGPVREVPQSP